MNYSNPVSAEPIKQAIEQALEEQRLVGTVVLAAHNGELIHCQAAGLADRESSRPMELNTVFRLASVTKPIIATAAMVLVAQGKLDLDGNIIQWLPDFQPRLAENQTAKISVRQLLSHTAGLSYCFSETEDDSPYTQAGISDGLDDTGISLAENLRRIATVPLRYLPGTKWAYSVSMDVLGALIEKVSGQPLEEAVYHLVTGPLNMQNTGFFVKEASTLATPYVSDSPQPHRLLEGETVPFSEGNVGVTYHPSRILNPHAFPSGGAGMAGTAKDVLRLLETLRQDGGSLLPKEWIEEMETDQIPGYDIPGSPEMGFGLGFSVLRNPALSDSPESVGTWSWGGVYGHSWFVDRAKGLSVVALTNTLYEGMSGQFVSDIRDAVYQTLST